MELLRQPIFKCAIEQLYTFIALLFIILVETQVFHC